MDFKVLEDALHLEEGTLANAGEDFKLDTSHIKIFKKDDYDTLLSNHASELKNKEDYSQTVGRETTLKRIVKEFLPETFEGRKDADKVVEALRDVVKAGSGNEEAQQELLKKIEAHSQVITEKDDLIKLEREKYNNLNRKKILYLLIQL